MSAHQQEAPLEIMMLEFIFRSHQISKLALWQQFLLFIYFLNITILHLIKITEITKKKEYKCMYWLRSKLLLTTTIHTDRGGVLVTEIF